MTVSSTLAGVFLKGTAAARPAANAVAGGTVYSATDTGVITQSDGSSWSTWATISAGMANPLTTKGGLIAAAAGGTPTELAVGGNGAVLQADSSQTTGIRWRLNKLDATVAPTVNEDSGDGYEVGSWWYDVTADQAYTCLDATVGAAVWRRVGASAIGTFTPTWTATSVNPAIGNGSLNGRYAQIHPKLLFVNVVLVIGSTTTLGTGQYRFAIPAGFTAATTQAISAWYIDASTGNYFAGTATVGYSSSSTMQALFGDGAGTREMSPSSPVVPANGDTIIMSGTFEVA